MTKYNKIENNSHKPKILEEKISSGMKKLKDNHSLSSKLSKIKEHKMLKIKVNNNRKIKVKILSYCPYISKEQAFHILKIPHKLNIFIKNWNTTQIASHPCTGSIINLPASFQNSVCTAEASII